jgi:hypothetical protein
MTRRCGSVDANLASPIRFPYPRVESDTLIFLMLAFTALGFPALAFDFSLPLASGLLNNLWHGRLQLANDRFALCH